MIAFCKSESLSDHVPPHERFAELLPAITRHACCAFRRLGPEAREEAVQEVAANAFRAFQRLVQLGKEDLAYATPLAMYAVRQVRAGRTIASRLSTFDVLSPYRRGNHGCCVERLDHCDRGAEWQQTLVEDRHAGPAETAAARIDVTAWFRSLPASKRKVARVLATGESTQETARKFGLTAGRISQLRRELAASWRKMHGGPATA